MTPAERGHLELLVDEIEDLEAREADLDEHLQRRLAWLKQRVSTYVASVKDD